MFCHNLQSGVFTSLCHFRSDAKIPGQRLLLKIVSKGAMLAWTLQRAVTSESFYVGVLSMPITSQEVSAPISFKTIQKAYMRRRVKSSLTCGKMSVFLDLYPIIFLWLGYI